MPCELCDRLTQARAGTHPALLAELSESFAFLADNQGCPGWCALLLKDHIEHLDLLPIDRQQRLFADVARVARAIRAAFPTSGRDAAPPRINYECLGNQAPHIHWHVIPRHADDPEPRLPIWGWPADRLKGSMTQPERDDLARRLRALLATK